jgi:hypothetical protein
MVEEITCCTLSLRLPGSAKIVNGDDDIILFGLKIEKRASVY